MLPTSNFSDPKSYSPGHQQQAEVLDLCSSWVLCSWRRTGKLRRSSTLKQLSDMIKPTRYWNTYPFVSVFQNIQSCVLVNIPVLLCCTLLFPGERFPGKIFFEKKWKYKMLSYSCLCCLCKDKQDFSSSSHKYHSQFPRAWLYYYLIFYWGVISSQIVNRNCELRDRSLVINASRCITKIPFA